jgi:hypothetical protein
MAWIYIIRFKYQIPSVPLERITTAKGRKNFVWHKQKGNLGNAASDTVHWQFGDLRFEG